LEYLVAELSIAEVWLALVVVVLETAHQQPISHH
jgi:hypothetical protein